MDFMSDVLTDERRFRNLKPSGRQNREVLGIEVEFCLPAVCVVCLLMHLVEHHGPPAQLRVDRWAGVRQPGRQDWCQA
jgi:putative transposase